MATYAQIAQYVLGEFGLNVSHLLDRGREG
jgi:hypothetical protein